MSSRSASVNTPGPAAPESDCSARISDKISSLTASRPECEPQRSELVPQPQTPIRSPASAEHTRLADQRSAIPPYGDATAITPSPPNTITEHDHEHEHPRRCPNRKDQRTDLLTPLVAVQLFRCIR